MYPPPLHHPQNLTQVQLLYLWLANFILCWFWLVLFVCCQLTLAIESTNTLVEPPQPTQSNPLATSYDGINTDAKSLSSSSSMSSQESVASLSSSSSSISTGASATITPTTPSATTTSTTSNPNNNNTTALITTTPAGLGSSGPATHLTYLNHCFFLSF